MEKFIQIENQMEFSEQLRLMIRQELSDVLSPLEKLTNKEKILSRDEVMKLFNISPSTLSKRMSDNSLPYFKIGRRVFFNEYIINQILRGES